MEGEPNNIPIQNVQPVAPTTPIRQTASPLPIQPKKSIFKTWWLWTIVGIVIIGLILGIVLLMSNESTESQNTSPQSPSESNQDEESTQTQEDNLPAENATESDNDTQTSNETDNETQHASTDTNFPSEDNCSKAAEALIIMSDPETFVNPETNSTSIKIQRSATEFNLLGVEITFITKDNIWKTEWTEELPPINGTSTQVFDSTELNYGTIEKAEVGAKIKLDNAYKICYGANRISIPLKS